MSLFAADYGHRFSPYADVCERCKTPRVEMYKLTDLRCVADDNPDEAFRAFKAEREFFERLSR